MRLVILDGGLGTELENRGIDVGSKLWSALAISEHPEAIYDVHMDYLNAGADVIITSSYQASTDGFLEIGAAKTETEAEQLIKKSIRIAKQARDDYAGFVTGRYCRVAASIGPFGAVLGDGSEYTGNYHDVAKDKIKTFHWSRLSLIVEEKPDILALETLPNFEEIQVLVHLVNQLHIPYWISLSLQDSRTLADGTPLTDVINYIKEHKSDDPKLLAVGANCFPMTMAVEVLSSLCELNVTVPLIIYPNSGETYHPSSKSWTRSESFTSLASEACRWYANGARYVGGCCRTRPADIRSLASVAKTL